MNKRHHFRVGLLQKGVLWEVYNILSNHFVKIVREKGGGGRLWKVYNIFSKHFIKIVREGLGERGGGGLLNVYNIFSKHFIKIVRGKKKGGGGGVVEGLQHFKIVRGKKKRGGGVEGLQHFLKTLKYFYKDCEGRAGGGRGELWKLVKMAGLYLKYKYAG